MLIRIAEKSDLPIIQEMNESAIPHVNSVTTSEFETFMNICSYFFVIEDSQHSVAGFMLVIGPGEEYDSINYQFFENNYPSFDYVDRIVIGEKYRGKGYGKELYTHLIKSSMQSIITCEINIKPPNPLSMSFHQKLGFKQVGKQATEGGLKQVSLMAREQKK